MSLDKSMMPALGMGTFRLEGDVAYDSVTMALDAGYRHIDTAQIYGNEAEVGRALADSGIERDELFITTKVWNDKLNTQDFLPSVRESLKKLQTDYVDLLLIHWPSPENNTPMKEYLGELLKAKEQGLAKHIGVSNFTIAHLKEALAILPDGALFTNQVEVHPYLINRQLREFCETKDIHVTAYMPFAVGKVLKDDTIVSIADKYKVTPAEIVIGWILAHGMSTIPSSTSKSHLETNLKGASVRLTDEDIARIDALDRNDRQATPDFAPEWDD